MDDDAQGPRYRLTSDRIVYFSGDSPSVSRRRRRHDTLVPDPDGIWWPAPLGAAAAAGDHRSSKRARVAASSEAILGLEEVTDRHLSGEECAICLNDFRADETLRAMPCSHAFHQHCISEWLRRNAVCPLCRHRLPTTALTPEEEDEQDSSGEEDWEGQVHSVVYYGGTGTPSTPEEEEEEQDGGGEEDGEDRVYWVVIDATGTASTPEEGQEQLRMGGEDEEHRMGGGIAPTPTPDGEDKQDGGGGEDGEDEEEEDYEWEDGGIILADESS